MFKKVLGTLFIILVISYGIFYRQSRKSGEGWVSPTPTPWPSQFFPCSSQAAADRLRQILNSTQFDTRFNKKNFEIIFVQGGTDGTQGGPSEIHFVVKMDSKVFLGHVPFDWNSCTSGDNPSVSDAYPTH